MWTENNITSIQMPTEKPHHYRYLKEFRTTQCPLFLQHKCTQHRPFTCFYWHFMNQRRRRPVRERDGTFSYSSDSYCNKFDETTGICPDGDECPLLHRTAGDTERRYHLRYYKTGTCVHETDAKGHCVKNGPHCAFAHGAHDFRSPLYDIQEIQTLESPDNIQMKPNIVEKERVLTDDPNWNDSSYVLSHYKTDPCKRPPRLCRQGYACPQFHNLRDRRRSPVDYKYRSTPCPHVKHGDDWGDPGQCELGDECSYCHTRTEQQFHPEIYKSTKCNDMAQNANCPRGPFCAFAHVDHENTDAGDLHIGTENPLAAYVSNVLPNVLRGPSHSDLSGRSTVLSSSWGEHILHKGTRGFQHQQHQQTVITLQRTSEADSTQHPILVTLGELAPSSANLATGSTPPQSTMISRDSSIYLPGDTVESVIGNALDDMNMDDFDLSSIDKELEKDDTNSIGSSYGTGLSQMYLGATSVPMNIPYHREIHYRGSLGSLSQSPSSPFGSSDHSAQLHSSSLSRLQVQQLQMEHKQEQLLEQAAAAFNRQPNPGKYAAAPVLDPVDLMATVVSPSLFVLGSDSIMTSTVSPSLSTEVRGLREELATNQAKLSSWEEGISQARCLRQQVDSLKKEREPNFTCDILHNAEAIDALELLAPSNLRFVRTQLASNMERIDQLLNTGNQRKCLVCQDKERSVILPCEHFVICHTCISTRHDCPYCEAHIVSSRSEPPT